MAASGAETPKGLHDCGDLRLTRHAIERFVERFQADPQHAESDLRSALARCRRLGSNPENGAIAWQALYKEQVLIAVQTDDACLTVLTWNQFEPHLAEFGRTRVPRKRKRWIGRLRDRES